MNKKLIIVIGIMVAATCAFAQTNVAPGYTSRVSELTGQWVFTFEL